MSDVATLISSSTAVIATAVSLFLLRQGQLDRRALRFEREREQAVAVSAWADWHTPEHATFAKPQLPAVFVRNSSGSVAYDVFVDYRTPVGGALVRQSIGPVPPGETRLMSIEYDGALDADWEPAALFPRVYFRDAAGKRWIRDALGRLRVDDEWGDDDFFRSGGVLLPSNRN